MKVNRKFVIFYILIVAFQTVAVFILVAKPWEHSDSEKPAAEVPVGPYSYRKAVMEQFELLRTDMKILNQKLAHIETTYHLRWDGKEWKKRGDYQCQKSETEQRRTTGD